MHTLILFQLSPVQNDGKMSLPEFSYDEVEVLRSLSVNDPDGPEKIVSPDDYLRPVSTIQHRPNSVTSYKVTTRHLLLVLLRPSINLSEILIHLI